MPNLWKTNSWANWPDNFTVLSFSPTWRRKRTPCVKDFFLKHVLINSFLQVGCQEPCKLGEFSNLAKVLLRNVQVVWWWPQVHPGDHCHTQPQIHKINHQVISVQISSSLQKSSTCLVNSESPDPHSPRSQDSAGRKGTCFCFSMASILDGPPWNIQPIPSGLLRTVEVATRSWGGHRGVPWDQFKFKNWNQLKQKAELNLSEMYAVTASFRLRPGAKPNHLYIHQAGKLKSWGRRRAGLASLSSGWAQKQRDESSLEISIA